MSEALTAAPGPVRRDRDRNSRPLLFLNGEFHLKVSAVETRGAFCVFDTIRYASGGPPLHVHHDQDEWFMVNEGIFDVRLGDTIHRLLAGDGILGPRGVPHAFRNVTPTGRIIVAFSPAGTMESFFAEGAAASPLSPAAFAELSARHGMTVVGPPLG